MATLRTRVKSETVSVELTVQELHRLLELQRTAILRELTTNSRRGRTRLEGSPQEDAEASPTTSLTELIQGAWPGGMDLVEQPELTTGNVRRFLIQRILGGAPSISTSEVCMRFFGRQLSPMEPADAADLRRVWYCIREAKRDIEAAVGGKWKDATDAPVRAGTFRAWKYVPPTNSAGQVDVLAYRERKS
jgi:hypothetical protein